MDCQWFALCAIFVSIVGVFSPRVAFAFVGVLALSILW